MSADAGVRAFIAALRRRVPLRRAPAALPDDVASMVREIRPDANLIQVFRAAGAANGTDVRVTDAAGWLDSVCDVLSSWRAQTVVIGCAGRGPLSAGRFTELEQRLHAAQLRVSRATDDETLFGADAAVTDSEAAIAETGTIVWRSGPGAARGATLIPPAHIAVVPASQIQPDLVDYFAALECESRKSAGASSADGSQAAANINLLTGPSKTADIEGTLVTGVHGPGRVCVVLLSDV